MRNMLSGTKWLPYTPQTPNYFCITGWENGGCNSLRLRAKWSPYPISMEASYDWLTWFTYTPNTSDAFTLTAWQKVYLRNTSTSNALFSMDKNNYWFFWANWTYECSWDVWYLINKNSTNTIPEWWFYWLFRWSKQILTPPELPATNLWASCYCYMFSWCTYLTTVPALPATTVNYDCYASMFTKCPNLESLPALPATILHTYCYNLMFYWCSKIKLSETQTWEYINEYRIPIVWTWADEGASTLDMFKSTWWTFVGTPTINTTYYTSNTIVS